MDVIVHRNKWCWGRSVYFVVNGGEGIVTISFADDSSEYATITGLSVIPEARKKGLGKKLIELAEEEAKKTPGVKHICINADEKEFVYDWYQRLGYKKSSGVFFLEYEQIKELVKDI